MFGMFGVFIYTLPGSRKKKEGEKVIFIIAYKLRRKNARRKIYSKFEAQSETEAFEVFRDYVKGRKDFDDKFGKSDKNWELLTGDWKHTCHYCFTCDRATDERCYECLTYERIVNNG